MPDRTAVPRQALFIVFGAALGLLVGWFGWGADSLALGLAVGASVGVVVGAVVELASNRLRR